MTDHLYALTGTYTHPWLEGAGPGLLIHDPVTALPFYLTHEREESLAVALGVSDDGGVSWQPWQPHDLWADAQRTLAAQEYVPGRTGPVPAGDMTHGLAAVAAEWLDARIRHVPPDDPAPRRPDPPNRFAWAYGGYIWSMTMGTMPEPPLLDRLAALYRYPPPEDVGRLRDGARTALAVLALAQDPADAPLWELLTQLHMLEFPPPGTGQLHGRIQDTQHRLIDELAAGCPRPPT